ncbi:hypothetical protein TB2_036170 [Malus domestica]
MSMGSSSSAGELMACRHACAACRHQRKRCEDDCVMAPYFTNKDEDFKAVHKIFGVSNMTKLLKQLDDQNHRGTAVQSFMWEAYIWKQDPVNGPLGMYRKLERENELLRNALNEEQKALALAFAASTMEEEPLALDQENHSNSGNINDDVEGVIPIYGNALNYGYANQSLAIDGSTNGTYTKLLQGQEATEMSQEQQVLGQGRGFHHGAALAKQQARDQQGVVGLDSSAGRFGMVGLMSTLQSQRPMQFGGRPDIGPYMYGQGRGQVVFDPSVGQGQQRALGSAGAAQIGPHFGDFSLLGHTRSAITQSPYSPYHHQQPHHPVHAQRLVMSQGQNHPNFQQYSSLNNCHNYDNVQDGEQFHQGKSERP